MSSPERKPRAAKLTPEALELLKERLTERHLERTQGHPKARLTRATRSALLGVSERTSDRIINGEAVDRASLQAAFAFLRLPWDDAYVEQPTQPEPASEPERTTSKRWFVPVVVATLSLLVIGVIFLKGSDAKSVPSDWQQPFRADMAQATDYYHRAEYAKAWPYLKRASALARETRVADAMAWALRVEADLLAAEGKKEAALGKIELALTYLKELDIPDQYFGALEIAANHKASLGRLEEARKDYLACLGQGEKTKNRYVIATACRGLGGISMKQKNFVEAAKWFDQGLTALGEDFEVDTAVDLRGRKALALANHGKFTEALPILEQCLAHWQEKKHPRWIAASQYRLGSVLKMKGDHVRADLFLAQARRGYLDVGDADGVKRCDEALK